MNTRQQTERRAKSKLSHRNNSKITSSSSSSSSDAAAASSSSCSSTSTSTLVQLLEVIRSEGWGGLYSGLKPSLFGTAASMGIYYYFYQVFKNKAEAIAVARLHKGRGDGSLGMFSWLLVAALAGSLNVLLTNPLWVLVTRMQTHTQAERKIMEERKHALLKQASETSFNTSLLHDKSADLDSLKPRPYGTLRAAHEVYSEAGIAGFWKGIIPTLIMVCNPSIQFMIYESSLKHLKSRRAARKQGHGSKNPTALEVFLLGALAKLGATISTYPLLVVKSRLQAKQEIGGNISFRYSGTIDAIIKMIRYEGLSSFYKGMSTKIVQSVFAASVLFMVKEEILKAYILTASKFKQVLSRTSSLVKRSPHAS